MTLPATQFLDDRGILYVLLPFPSTTGRGAANVARALGYKQSQMVKTLIFDTGEGFRAFIDQALMDEKVLGVGAGEWGYEIMITPVNLVKGSNAIVVNLTDRTKPVC